MKKYLFLFLVFQVLFFASKVSAVPIISYTENDLGGDIWQYDYKIENLISDPYLWFLTFEFSNEKDVEVLSVPTGWYDPLWMMGTNTTGYLDIYSLDLSNDLAPGSYLDGYSFTTIGQLGDVSYTAFYADHNVTVPEPASFVLLLSFAIPLFVRRERN